MNGPPPDWGDIPDAGPDSYGTGTVQRGNRQDRPAGRDQRKKMEPAEIAAAADEFYTWLASADTTAQLRLMLPDHVDLDLFVATCKTAVLNRPQVLAADLRGSLLMAVMKAASQGLKPDGKEGALVVRWDSESYGHAVVWQPMVWGIMKLGRETGAIKSIRAVIVYQGEKFRIVQGEHDLIEHEVDPDIVEEAYQALSGGLDQKNNPIARPDEFFARVRAAYCFITGTDGTVTKRWMTKNRLISLRQTARAQKGPWNSRFIDEMILKGVILFTSKWVNLDTSTGTAKRFQSALMTDLEVDFDRQGQITSAPEVERTQPALPPPESKLDGLETLFQKRREKEFVPAAVVDEEARPTIASDRPPAGTNEGGGETAPPPSPAPEPPAEPPAPPADTPTLETRANAAMSFMGGMTAEQVEKVITADRYKHLIRDLHAAGRMDLIDQIAEAVGQARRNRPV